MTAPSIEDWAVLTDEERALVARSMRDPRPHTDPEAQAQFSAYYKECLAIIEPYVKGLGKFVITHQHSHHFGDLDDPWVRDRVVSSIVHGMLQRCYPMRAPVARYLVAQHAAGAMCELIGAELARCWACGAYSHVVEMTGTALKPLVYDRNRPLHDPSHIELPDCPIDPKLPYSVEVDIPSGRMVVANHLSPLFKEIRDKYAPEKSINYLVGRKRCSEEYAEQGYVEMNIGNCSCVMYRTNKAGSRFVMGAEGCVQGRPRVADVCTDFWGYGIADHALALKNGLEAMQAERPHMRMYVVDCKSGRYRFTHRYHLTSGDKPESYTHITRVGEVKT